MAAAFFPFHHSGWFYCTSFSNPVTAHQTFFFFLSFDSMKGKLWGWGYSECVFAVISWPRVYKRLKTPGFAMRDDLLPRGSLEEKCR